MGITEEPWTSAAAGLELVQLPPAVLDALADGDLDAARAVTTLELTPYLAGAECVGVWRRRRDQIARSPADAAWVTRLVIERGSRRVVGRAGYHGPPDDVGVVEIGYSIDPARRRRGHARGALVILLETAKYHPAVAVVRATVRPDNVPSRRLLDQYGFQAVGEQWDEEDGLETILEAPCPGS
ncbi:GNAT family N-acetyltransferase [Pseudarthrobacter sp. S9]|uniref:GNAT family N-acetyltransferase n=1 Tax=Pseudarthrobacter sp. S9 TaxID=3418421 RepID=UPI003D091AC5